MRSQWVDLVTGWNREGVAWRRFNAVELLWLFHRYTFEYLTQNHKTQVRKYLIGVADTQLLGLWDAGSFKDSGMDGGDR